MYYMYIHIDIQSAHKLNYSNSWRRYNALPMYGCVCGCMYMYVFFYVPVCVYLHVTETDINGVVLSPDHMYCCG